MIAQALVPLVIGRVVDGPIRRHDTSGVWPLALLALALAAVGLFGVLSYRVQQRTREIGIRIALGAGTRDVERHVVTRALVPVAGGLVVGIGLSRAATRVLGSLLFRVNAVDLPTLAAVAIVMLSTALLASWIPARRAARVDPVRALQAE